MSGLNVQCIDCGSLWTAEEGSPNWWRAKRHIEEGHVDAVAIDGEVCGCVKKSLPTDAPFLVSGYNDLCEDFEIPCTSFTEAIKTYREMDDGLSVVFIKGVSRKVESRLERGW